MSRSATGRRNARRASVDRIWRAHVSVGCGAAENPLPARRVTRPCDVVRTAQLHAADRRRQRDVARVLVARHRIKRPAHAFRPCGLLHKADRNHLRTRGRGEAHLCAIDADVAGTTAGGLGSANGDLLHLGAVEPHLQRVRLREAADAAVVGAIEEDLDDVGPVDREVIADGRAAARSKRQVVAHPVVLLQVFVDLEGIGRGADVRIADREAADLQGRRQVPFRQHRRHRQDIRDVVETES